MYGGAEMYIHGKTRNQSPAEDRKREISLHPTTEGVYCLPFFSIIIMIIMMIIINGGDGGGGRGPLGKAGTEGRMEGTEGREKESTHSTRRHL